jgi:hypothetical protein
MRYTIQITPHNEYSCLFIPGVIRNQTIEFDDIYSIKSIERIKSIIGNNEQRAYPNSGWNSDVDARWFKSATKLHLEIIQKISSKCSSELKQCNDKIKILEEEVKRLNNIISDFEKEKQHKLIDELTLIKEIDEMLSSS